MPAKPATPACLLNAWLAWQRSHKIRLRSASQRVVVASLSFSTNACNPWRSETTDCAAWRRKF
ncbi:MAG: hypothetical protein HY300_16925 [Verrucomicrobia bacterium]|nr:hypothetical protein [Verrucomicrobiota bacterium]